MASQLAKRYARALLETIPLEKAKEYSLQLETLSKIYSDSSQLRETLNNPSISKDIRVEIALEIAQKLFGTDSLVANTFAVLVRNRRANEVPNVAIAFAELVNELSKTLTISVSTAFEIADDEKSQLLSTLQSRFGGLVKANWLVEPELLGGIKIQSGDRVVDNSIRASLDSAKIQLIGV